LVGGHYLSHIIAQISTASQQLVKFCIVLAIGSPPASCKQIHTTFRSLLNDGVGILKRTKETYQSDSDTLIADSIFDALRSVADGPTSKVAEFLK
jgi:hypothetical protein